MATALPEAKRNDKALRRQVLVVGLQSFLFASALGFFYIPLPLHARTQMGDAGGAKMARWMGLQIGMRVPFGLAVGALGAAVEAPSILLAVCGFLVAAAWPQEDLAIWGLCLLTSATINVRSTLNLRMKAIAQDSPERLAQVSSSQNRGRLLGRIFRGVAAASLYEAFGLGGVCVGGSFLCVGLMICTAESVAGGSPRAASPKPAVAANGGGIRAAWAGTHWQAWAMAFSFTFHEFFCNMHVAVSPVAATRVAGLSSGQIGLVASFGLFLTLMTEPLVALMPVQWTPKRPLNAVNLTMLYGAALFLMSIADSAPTFILSSLLAIVCENVIQKCLMELIMGGVQAEHMSVVLAVMETTGAVLGSFGASAGSLLVAADTSLALRVMGMLALVHVIFQLLTFAAAAASEVFQSGFFATGAHAKAN